VFTIKYSDDWPSGDRDNGFGDEKTDNDVAALKALEDAVSMEITALKREVERQRCARLDNSGAEPGVPAANLLSGDFDNGDYWENYFVSDSGAVPPENAIGPGHQSEAQSQPQTQVQPQPEPAAREDAAFDYDASYEAEEPKQPPSSKRKVWRSSPRKKRWPLFKLKTSKAQKRGIITAVCIAGALLIGMIIVAEPWVPAAADNYTEPEPKSLSAPIVLEVGQSVPIEVPLGDNETVDSIVTRDNDIISVMDSNVTALGEWDSVTVVITTKEIAVPEPELKPASFLGMDITVPYNRFRAGLRDFFGIEKKQLPRKDLRVLNVYEQEIRVQGYRTDTEAAPINLFANDYCEMKIISIDSEEIEFEYEGDVIKIDKTVPDDDGYVTYTARSSNATGKGKVIVKIGFYKDDKFVTTRAVVYDVEVINRPGPGGEAIFASGNYNGNIKIEEEDAQS